MATRSRIAVWSALAAAGLLALGLPVASWADPPEQARARLAQLTGNELNTLRDRIAACWNVPPALAKAPNVVVSVLIRLNPDGSLAGAPQITNKSDHPLFETAARSAAAAVRRCAPFSFLPAAKYALWKELEISFDSRVLRPQ